MTILLIILHFLCNIGLGYVILNLIDKTQKSQSLWIIEAFLAGAFLETMIGFVLLMIGVSERYAFFIGVVITIAYLAYRFIIKKNISLSLPKVSWKFKPIEIILLIPIVTKLLLAFFQLIKQPIYFDDAMTHWAGRAHALYSKVNWSMDVSSDFFLGSQFGFKEYPLFLVIWRSINAGICGEWNDVIARADSFIFYLLIIISVFVITNRMVKIRWIAFAAAFIISAVPLMHIHGTSGYSEIAICLMVLVIYNAITEASYIKAGLITALCIWTKNEGLFLFFPIFSICILYVSYFRNRNFLESIKSLLAYGLTTMIFISPWFIFKHINEISFSVIASSGSHYRADSFSLFLNKIFNSPSSNIFWIIFFLFLIVGFKNWIKRKEYIVGVLIVMLTLCMLGYVFCFTDAHKFLLNDMTAHRSLLQIAPIATIMIILSMKDKILGAAKTNSEIPTHPDVSTP